MKVLHISSSDGGGGAAIAARRIHLSFNEKSNVMSSMFVSNKTSNYEGIFTYRNDIAKFYAFFKRGLGKKISKLQKTDNKVLHSVSCLPCRLDKFINSSSYDLIHLHWLQGEMMSIESIGRIKKPLIWTLHDNWAFSGSEHLPFDRSDTRYQEGYKKRNKPAGHKSFDFDRWCWERKRKSWNNKIKIVCPSNWLKECAEKSALMKSWDINLIPHPLDIEIFKPWPKKVAKDLFKLPLNKKIILFGSMDGTNNFNKGWDLLSKSLKIISSKNSNFVAVIFGQSYGNHLKGTDIPVYYAGKLQDSESLAMLYSAADLMVVPSRMESFCQTASESTTCGTPVIGFKYSGLKDIISHNETGFLIEPYDYKSLANGILELLVNEQKLKEFSIACRNKAVDLWSYKRISEMYFKRYLELLDSNLSIQNNKKFF